VLTDPEAPLLSTGEVVGIVVGVIAAVAILIGIAVYVR
jgi:hypothetical protein